MLNYKRVGGGENHVVFLHGYSENLNLWNKLSNSLQNDYNCLLIDLPGFGESDIDKNTSIEEMAASLDGLLSQLGIEQAVVLGHSMGGYIALEYAHQFPHKCLGLGLIHSTAQADSQLKIDNRKKTIRFLEMGNVKDYAKIFTPQLFAPDNRSNVEFINEAFEMVSNSSSKGLQNAMEVMIGRKDRNHLFSDLDIPYLFIAGKHDEMIPYQNTLKESSLCKRSMVFLFEKEGHISMIENPNKCQKAVEDYLLWVYN